MRFICAFVDCMYKEDSKKFAGEKLNIGKLDCEELNDKNLNQENSNNKKADMKKDRENMVEYGKIRKKFELNENLLEESENIWAEVQREECLQDVTPPSDMHGNILKVLREEDEQRARMRLSDEEKELIQLGKIYKKRKKGRKYLVLVAAVVMALALGITSVGEGEKIFEKIAEVVFGRERTNVDSDEVIPVADVTEEEVYQEIEDKYGVVPVRMTYYPEGIALQETLYMDEMQGVSMLYGVKDYLSIKYSIRPNYRNGSWGQDFEDELVDEYEIMIENVAFRVKQYVLTDGTSRWSVRFEYQDVAYSLVINKLEKIEVEKIIRNLYFA